MTKKIRRNDVAAIEILRASAIARLNARGYGKFRIIWQIYRHEKRCQLCRRLIEIRDRREQREQSQ